MAVDNDKLMDLLGRFVGDMAATAAAGSVVVGHRLGLYRALAEGPATPEQLAERTGCHPRYLTEWLSGQAAGGYVEYSDGRFSMTEEQAFALTDPSGPVYLPGAFVLGLAMLRSEPAITEAFRTGAGVGWHEHDDDLFIGTELFFRPGYLANLTTSWIPALDGVEAKLTAGATVADIGCGLGSSSVLLAQAFPRTRIVGSDYHLVTSFDCIHDMGDPLGAARHVRESLAPDGTWMVVEPAAGDRLEDNLNPVGRLYYSASTFLCVPNGLSQPGGYALGAQAGEAAIRQVATDAGFTRFRRAAETPFNFVYEVRP
jgi:hypothetical protein